MVFLYLKESKKEEERETRGKQEARDSSVRTFITNPMAGPSWKQSTEVRQTNASTWEAGMANDEVAVTQSAQDERGCSSIKHPASTREQSPGRACFAHFETPAKCPESLALCGFGII